MFTEKHFKGSKNIYKADQSEINSSIKFHLKAKAIPILISPKFLRRRGLGQVDICLWHENKIEIIEVKSSHIGIIAIKNQRIRLRRSAFFLSKVFDKTAVVLFHSSNKEKLGNHFLS